MRQALAIILLLLFSLENVAYMATNSEGVSACVTSPINVQKQAQPGFTILAEENEEKDLKDDSLPDLTAVVTGPLTNPEASTGKIHIVSGNSDSYRTLPIYKYVRSFII